MLALLVIAAMRVLTNFYMVQEILVVLLLLAVLMVSILTLAVACILIHEGIRSAVLWAKIGLMRLASLSPQDQSGDALRRLVPDPSQQNMAGGKGGLDGC
jgi:hypothetical protein